MIRVGLVRLKSQRPNKLNSLRYCFLLPTEGALYEDHRDVFHVWMVFFVAMSWKHFCHKELLGFRARPRSALQAKLCISRRCTVHARAHFSSIGVVRQVTCAMQMSSAFSLKAPVGAE